MTRTLPTFSFCISKHNSMMDHHRVISPGYPSDSSERLNIVACPYPPAPPKDSEDTKHDIDDLPLASTIRKRLESDDAIKLTSMVKAVGQKLQTPQWTTKINFPSNTFRDVKQRDVMFERLKLLLGTNGFAVTLEHNETDRDVYYQSTLSITIPE